METINILTGKYNQLKSHLDEKATRLWAASEAIAIGWGGITQVSQATGISHPTIAKGISELKNSENTTVSLPKGRVRRSGAGRKRLEKEDKTLLYDLEMMIEPTKRGDPQSPLCWTCKSTENLAVALRNMGHTISDRKVAQLLKTLGYSLQANRKVKEGGKSPYRDQQFEFINERVKAFQKKNQPTISVDAKKRELMGDFKNPGLEWQPRGKPEQVRVYDFPDKKLGKATPYGIYDLHNNEGYVNVGIDHNTAEFAVYSIEMWWEKMGHKRFPEGTELLIMADGGSSNSSSCRLWKWELQQLSNQTGLTIEVCHFPPGTSKWNKIEHRMFCHISQNWRGKPLVDLETIVNLIGNTKTSKGLQIVAQADKKTYPTGREVSDAEYASINITRNDFQEKWNYVIAPNSHIIL